VPEAAVARRHHRFRNAQVYAPGKVSLHLLYRAHLLAIFGDPLPQPPRQLLGKRIQLTRPVRKFELRLHRVRPQIFGDCGPRQPRTPLNRTDRDLLPKMPATNYAQ
jgi:hypothetical protein